jgi:hypothetical protein
MLGLPCDRQYAERFGRRAVSGGAIAPATTTYRLAPIVLSS